MKVAIIMPAYNEEERIEKTLREYTKFLRKNKVNFEINVIINNTSDNTEKIVKNYSKSNKEIRYLNFKQGGKGFAITEGFKDSLKRKNDLIGFVDADMATSPEAFYDLIKNIDESDGIIASRYVPGAIIKQKQPLNRVIVSRIGNLIIRVLFWMNYRDTQAGAKLFKRKPLKKVIPNLSVSHWAFDVDLLYQFKKQKFKIIEYPTIWENKEGSKLNLKKASIQVLLSLIKLRISNILK